jgi:hypothetical protein
MGAGRKAHSRWFRPAAATCCRPFPCKQVAGPCPYDFTRRVIVGGETTRQPIVRLAPRAGQYAAVDAVSSETTVDSGRNGSAASAACVLRLDAGKTRSSLPRTCSGSAALTETHRSPVADLIRSHAIHRVYVLGHDIDQQYVFPPPRCLRPRLAIAPLPQTALFTHGSRFECKAIRYLFRPGPHVNLYVTPSVLC